MGTLRKLLSLAEPNQPVEIWLIATLTFIHGGTWTARVKLFESDAAKIGLTNHSIPRGCNGNNPLVIVKVLGMNDCPPFNMDKKDFLDKFANIPLMPTKETFFQRYQEVIDTYGQELEDTIKTLKEINANIDRIIHDTFQPTKPAQ